MRLRPAATGACQLLRALPRARPTSRLSLVPAARTLFGDAPHTPRELSQHKTMSGFTRESFVGKLSKVGPGIEPAAPSSCSLYF